MLSLTQTTEVVVLLRDFKVSAFIALGANLGNAQQSLLQAIAEIKNIPGCSLHQTSSFYKSAAIQSSGPDYINAVLSVETVLTAPDLLKELFKIEKNHGRERPFWNAPRTLDLDLLLYGSATIQSTFLQVPHPRMYQRAFVLLPLQEIAPQLVTTEQINSVSDQSIVKII